VKRFPTFFAALLAAESQTGACGLGVLLISIAGAAAKRSHARRRTPHARAEQGPPSPRDGKAAALVAGVETSWDFAEWPALGHWNFQEQRRRLEKWREARRMEGGWETTSRRGCRLQRRGATTSLRPARQGPAAQVQTQQTPAAIWSTPRRLPAAKRDREHRRAAAFGAVPVALACSPPLTESWAQAPWVHRGRQSRQQAKTLPC